MKMHELLSAVWGVRLLCLLALNGVRMVSARHNWDAPQTMYAFGDSFVDSGNVPKHHQLGETSRQWFYPYGVSNAQEKATGRFSDFMVQSDFIAKMLGLPMSPPTYESTPDNTCDPTGMNFASATTGVFGRRGWLPLRWQVNSFKTMVKGRTISKNHVSHSVALIGSSANDYKHFQGITNSWQVADFAFNVTSEIAANVERLQNLGVKRVLVNNLHPLGCTPSLSRKRKYKVCDDSADDATSVHNYYLEQKLGKKKGVLILDLYTAFDRIMGHGDHNLAQDTDSYKQLKHTRKPCCESIDPKGFCGQLDKNSKQPLYSLCEDPGEYFFWDEANPTHAGWEAVMKQLHDPIKQFIGAV